VEPGRQEPLLPEVMPGQSALPSFDHRVGPGEEFGWDRQAEGAGRAQIKGHLKMSWLFDWEIARLDSFQYLVHING
jgi:hypothetical protein